MDVQMVNMNKNENNNSYNYYNVDQYGNQTGNQIGINQPDNTNIDPNNENALNLNQPQENPNNINVNNLEEVKKEEEAKKLAEDIKPVIKENPIQKEFKNIFKGNDYYNNDKTRKRLMHLLFFCIIQDLIILEVLW
jgi:hypothetical protein